MVVVKNLLISLNQFDCASDQSRVPFFLKKRPLRRSPFPICTMSKDNDEFLTSADFIALGASVVRKDRNLTSADGLRRFRALFGLSPKACCFLWQLLATRLPPSPNPAHLLWGLLFLKVYRSEHVHATITGVDEKTFRKWSWAYINLFSLLQMVRSFLLDLISLPYRFYLFYALLFSLT